MGTLFLLSSLNIGGSERKSVRIVNALRDRGRDVHLAWLNGPETLRQEIHPGVPAVCFDRRGKFSWPVVRRLARYVRDHRIARIVCMNQYPLLYATALRLAMGNTAPSSVVTINTTEFNTRKGAAQMAIYAPLMRRAASVVFGCDYQLNLWIDRYRLPRSRCHHIYNGVDSEYFSPQAPDIARTDHRATFGCHRNDFVLGTVGNFRPEKQQGDLIEAVARLRARGLPAMALLVGDGSEKRSLIERAASAGIADFVRFPGKIRDVRPTLAAMDIFVLTSTSETFSNAALEAMSMGKPVVLSNVGGAREMVWEGINGFLYPPSDLAKLSAILEELAGNRVAVRQMGEEARRIAVERFSFSRMVDQYDSLCSESPN
jgi:glycosyltransferase involved in cell wall biosynthesis